MFSCKWIKLVADRNHILAAENIRNYQRAVLKIKKKSWKKYLFFDTHIRAKMESNASHWDDSLRCRQTEVYFKFNLVQINVKWFFY